MTSLLLLKSICISLPLSPLFLWQENKISRHLILYGALEVHPVKTKLVILRGYSSIKYTRSFDFLGFTLRPHWSRTSTGLRLMPYVGISRKLVNRILEKFKLMQIHKWRKPIEVLAAKLSPVIRGVLNYYCIGAAKASVYLWNQLNLRLLKWVRWEKRLPMEAALRWLRKKYRQKPALFPHLKLVYPWYSFYIVKLLH